MVIELTKHPFLENVKTSISFELNTKKASISTAFLGYKNRYSILQQLGPSATDGIQVSTVLRILSTKSKMHE